jgi:hypothetical protein
VKEIVPSAHMCYIAHMDTTIRNLDESMYRALKAQAALSGRTIGDTVNEAIRTYLATADPFPKTRTLRDLVPRPYPEGNDRLSEEVDAVVYGTGEAS